MQETGADNVGGIMAAEGVTPFEQAVAWAMTSPAGVGSARFHTGGRAGPADSVYLGVYRRAALEQVGGYDESYLRAEDWEMNHRIRQAGGLIWFQPGLRVTYRPRATAGRARQAVLPLRPLAPGGRPPARGHDQPALPRPAGDAARDRRGPGGGPRRAWPTGSPITCPRSAG